MNFYASGKLMLSGEYVVLNGATAFAVPVRFGQSLQVSFHEEPFHYWESYDTDGKWLEVTFSKDLSTVLQTNDAAKALRLQKILQFIKLEKPGLWFRSRHFITRLNFDRHWGLGSSSTLIALLHRWSGVDAFKLLETGFGGSGYDIAVALENRPVLYRLASDTEDYLKQSYRQKYPVWQTVDYHPPFADDLFFVYLNQKQNTHNEVKKYRQKSPEAAQIAEIDQISRSLPFIDNLSGFERAITRHEEILSAILQRPALRERLFPDYPGSLKSLGAWGGDFILATGPSAPEYFKNKGFELIFPFKQMYKVPPAL